MPHLAIFSVRVSASQIKISENVNESISSRVWGWMKWDERGKALGTRHALSKGPSSPLLLLELLLLPPPRGAAPLSKLIVSFACGNPRANVSRAFDISNSRNVMNTTIVVVLLGLQSKCAPTSASLISRFECLLQPFTNKWVQSLEHALSPVGSLPCNPLRPYSTEAGNYHSNRSMWRLRDRSETKHLPEKNPTHTRTLICNVKFYFMVFMKGNHASE